MWPHLAWWRNPTSKLRPYPHPYNIQWLNQGKGLQVNSRYLISFSIGKNYQDELGCDIIPMYACHVLLRRPQLFDKEVMHDSYLNTYTLSKDGKNITLSPLSPSQLHKKNPNRTESTPISFSPLVSHFLRLLIMSVRPLMSGFSLPMVSPKALPQAIYQP